MARTTRTLGVLALAGASLLGPASAAGAACNGVQGWATTAFDPNVGGFVGTATFRVRGAEHAVPAQAFLTGADSTVHHLSFPAGDIATVDDMQLTLIDEAEQLYALDTRLEIVAGGTGHLRTLPGSTIDLDDLVATWRMTGVVCFE